MYFNNVIIYYQYTHCTIHPLMDHTFFYYCMYHALRVDLENSPIYSGE